MSKWFIEHNAKIKKFVCHCDVVALYSQKFLQIFEMIRHSTKLNQKELFVDQLPIFFSNPEYENRNQFLLK